VAEQRKPILILEDNDEWRMLLTMLLTHRGLRVVGIGRDPGLGFDWTRFQVVVCDWMLAGVDPPLVFERYLLPLDPAERPRLAVMSVVEERMLEPALRRLRVAASEPVPYLDKTWAMQRLFQAIQECL
jgi:CheY-like chemotaxis protein